VAAAMGNKEIVQRIKELLTVVQSKKANSMHIKAQLTPEISAETEAIRTRNEEDEPEEAWNTESVCFRYFNFFQQFKSDMVVEIDWLQFCARGGSLDDKKMQQLEQMKGIHITKK